MSDQRLKDTLAVVRGRAIDMNRSDAYPRLVADLATANARADGYALFVQELQAAWDGIKWMAEKYAEAGGSRSIEMEDYEAADAILAADPEVRAAELLANGEETGV